MCETDLTVDHFSRYAPERIEYGVNRYVNETRRLYSVIDKHLASDNRPYLVGDKCTIAGKCGPRIRLWFQLYTIIGRGA